MSPWRRSRAIARCLGTALVLVGCRHRPAETGPPATRAAEREAGRITSASSTAVPSFRRDIVPVLVRN